MGRLVAAVIALAVFVTGAMYWSQAEQLSESDMPLPPEISIKVATDGCPEGGCTDEAKDKTVQAGKAEGECTGGGCADKQQNATGKDGCCGGDKSTDVSNV